VRNLIYPVPDPAFPFLGVHFTRKLSGAIEAGPNAVLAFRREGYGKASFSVRDALSVLLAPGFVGFAARHARMGIGEFRRSFSKRLFVDALRELVPELGPDDVTPGGSGVRAQAMDRQGRLVDDFHVVEAARMLHVLNAPSPAATASLAIGRVLAERAAILFGL
jgi:L-2-hydroxyglutarate oxidase